MQRHSPANPGDPTRSAAVLEARYMNYFAIGFNAFEFIFDIGQYHSEDETARIHTRIVTGPAFAKLFAEMLRDAIDRFQSQHGDINASDEADPAKIAKHSAAGNDGGP